MQRVCVCVDELTGQGPSPPPFLAACLSQAIQKVTNHFQLSGISPPVRTGTTESKGITAGTTY